MDLGNLHVRLHGLDGNSGYIKSLSDKDIEKLKQALNDLQQAITDIEQLKGTLENNDFAVKSGDNTFTGTNTFTNIPTITNSQTLESLQDNDVVKGETLKELSSDVSDLIDKSLQVKYQENPPQEGEVQEKVFIICPSLDLLI